MSSENLSKQADQSKHIHHLECKKVRVIPAQERVSLKIAAGELGISENSLRLRFLRGTSPVDRHKVGGRVYIFSADIKQFYLNGGWDTI